MRKILDSVNWESNTLIEELIIGDRYNSKRVLKLKKLKTALKDQFAKTEASFLDVLLDGAVFDEFDRLVKYVRATEKVADNALLKSEKFLELRRDLRY